MTVFRVVFEMFVFSCGGLSRRRQRKAFPAFAPSVVAVAALFYASVFLCEFVASMAMRLGPVVRGGTDTTQDVCAMRHGFQVARIETGAIPTKVIDSPCLRYRALCQGIRDAVQQSDSARYTGNLPLDWPHIHTSVPVARKAKRGNPTGVFVSGPSRELFADRHAVGI